MIKNVHLYSRFKNLIFEVLIIGQLMWQLILICVNFLASQTNVYIYFIKRTYTIIKTYCGGINNTDAISDTKTVQGNILRIKQPTKLLRKCQQSVLCMHSNLKGIKQQRNRLSDDLDVLKYQYNYVSISINSYNKLVQLLFRNNEK
jgi:hypothetical protein